LGDGGVGIADLSNGLLLDLGTVANSGHGELKVRNIYSSISTKIYKIKRRSSWKGYLCPFFFYRYLCLMPHLLLHPFYRYRHF
jgi:hypothetical protein